MGARRAARGKTSLRHGNFSRIVGEFCDGPVRSAARSGNSKRNLRRRVPGRTQHSLAADR